MSRISVAILSPEAANGRDVVALGVIDALSARMRTGLFRPAACRRSAITSLLLQGCTAEQDPSTVRGVCTCRVRKQGQDVRADIVAAYERSVNADAAQAMVIVGTDRSPIDDPSMFTFNAQVAADLQAPVLLSVCALHRTPAQVKATAEACRKAVEQTGTAVLGLFITQCRDDQHAPLLGEFDGYGVPVWTIPPVNADDNTNGDDEDRDGIGIDDAFASVAVAAFRARVPQAQLLDAITAPFTPPTTPYAFQHGLMDTARRLKRTIVLPEGQEPRILQAADYLLERNIVNLVILGERDCILSHGEKLGLRSLHKARFQSMDDESVLASLADRLCTLRAHKGMTMSQARTQLADPSYFGTMLVVSGAADGLVSGAVNSTAATVRPALQVIRTKDDASLVSGAFIMCFKDHVALFADCAINPNPDAGQLADIAIQSARTARSFGLVPRVGMLSYSTLGSGSGKDIDLVERATRLVRQRDPDLPVVGPIQFDAAWSPTVAAAKAPGNEVAGHVNVFVFPDLCAGNIAYKAVQRSSGALAVGPVLQGLRQPVNDLSRGASVRDIVNTVALTAIEAQDL